MGYIDGSLREGVGGLAILGSTGLGFGAGVIFTDQMHKKLGWFSINNFLDTGANNQSIEAMFAVIAITTLLGAIVGGRAYSAITGRKKS